MGILRSLSRFQGRLGRSPSSASQSTLWLWDYILVVGWALLGAIASSSALPFAQGLEWETRTLFFKWRGCLKTPEPIVIVAIDEASIQQGGLYPQNPETLKFLEPISSIPWKRQAYAIGIEKVMAAGAIAVGVDVVFDFPGRDEADDRTLEQTLQTYAGSVTLAAFYDSFLGDEGIQTQLITPHSRFRTTPESLGYINYTLEVDERIHRFTRSPYPTIVSQKLGLPDIPSFPVATLQSAGVPFSQQPGQGINYYGAARYCQQREAKSTPSSSFDLSSQNTFVRIPFYYLLDPERWNAPPLNQGRFFRNKIVLIGPTAEEFQDIQVTPFGLMPGVEVHAHAIATLLENRIIQDVLPQPGGRGLAVFLFLLGTGASLTRLPRSITLRLFVSLAVIGMGVAIAYWSFVTLHLVFPVAIPMASLGLIGGSQLMLTATTDQLEKKRLRRILERYVSSPIAAEILRQPEDFQQLLAGRKLLVAVLFSDIRGFSTLTLKLPPEQLVQQLNAYFDRMVEAIIEQQGTVDKFIGDAIMAEFGSPLSQGLEQDVRNAVRAALLMRQALADLRQQWQKSGEPLFFNGIGIHCGEVLAGNIGSSQRLEYTVIGDAVNVASRLEGLTKTLHTDIIISQAVYEVLQDEIEVVPLGVHELKGRAGIGMELYSVVGWHGEDPSLYHQVQHELRQYLT